MTADADEDRKLFSR